MNVKRLVRSALEHVGIRVWRARGGLFVYRVPRPRRDGVPARGAPSRLHLGCGNVRLEGYVNVDIIESPATDLVADIATLPCFESGSVVEIKMSAVYEHLFPHVRERALVEWRRLLAPGGTLVIEYVPDFDVAARAYAAGSPGNISNPMSLDEVARYTHGDPQPLNAPEQLHKDIFTREKLVRELHRAGFEIVEIANVCFRDEPVAVNLNVIARRR